MRPDRIGPYEVLDELGRGGMGVVFRARHAELGQEVALKLIGEGLGDDEDRARFQREAAAAARVAGLPGLVGVHDFGEAVVDGAPTLWFAMELVDGEAFDEVLTREDWSPEGLAKIFAGVARALEGAHAAGVIHRDLKPSNILIRRDGQPCITDFGLAKLAPAGAELERLTASGMILGTPVYMAPEQARGETVDARADVYALGASLYEACSGAPPFDAESNIEVISRLLREEPVPLRRLRPDLPRPLAAIVMQCLERAPALRYPSAAALADDLERFLSGDLVTARPPSLGRRLWRRRKALAAAGLVIAGSVGSVAAWWHATDEQRSGDGAVAVTGGHTARADAAKHIAEVSIVLEREVLEPLQVLQDVRFGAPVAPDAIAAAMERLRAACEAAEAQHPGTLIPESWELLGRYYAGEGPASLQALKQLAERAGDNPVPGLLLTRVYLSAWLVKLGFPDNRISPRSVEAAAFTESADQKKIRKQLAGALEPVLDSTLWPLLPQLDEYRRFAGAVETLAKDDAEGAAAALRVVVDHPAFGAEARAMLAHALFLQREYLEAARELQQVAERGWPGAWANTAQCWMAHGATIVRADAPEAFDALERGLAATNQWLALEPQNGEAHTRRGLARYLRALRGQHRGEDSVPMLTAAVADFDAAEELGGRLPRLIPARALARLILSRRATDRGEDPTPLLRQAVADLARLAPAAAGGAAAHTELAAGLHYELAHVAVRAGADPSADMARAIAAWTGWLDHRPEDADALRDRARGYSQWMAWRQRWPGFPDGGELAPLLRADLERLVKLRPDWPLAWEITGRFEVSEAARTGDDSHYTAALAAFDRGIALPDAPAKLWALRGTTRLNWGHQSRSASERAKLWTTALADLDAAVARDDADAETFEWRASAREGLAGLYRTADAARSQAWDLGALADLEAATRLNPSGASGWLRLGGSRVNQAYRIAAGADRITLLEAAAAALANACELAPGDSTAWLFRGNAHSNLGRELPPADLRWEPATRAALEYYARAVALKPALQGRVARTVRSLQNDLAKAGK